MFASFHGEVDEASLTFRRTDYIAENSTSRENRKDDFKHNLLDVSCSLSSNRNLNITKSIADADL
jgi:hypothetical protein